MTKNFKIEEENAMVTNEQADKKLNKNFEVLEDKEIEKQNNFDEVLKFEAYGGFWRRLVSSVMDWLPAFAAFSAAGIFSLMSKSTLGVDASDFPGSMGKWNTIIMIVSGVIIIINISYNLYSYFKEGKTLGYKMLGMQVISAETGRLPTVGALLGRWGMKLLLTGIPYVGTIGSIVTAIMIGVNKNKQGPHDMVAKTLVVMKDKKKNTWAMWASLALLVIFILFSIWGIIKFLDSSGISYTEFNSDLGDNLNEAVDIDLDF